PAPGAVTRLPQTSPARPSAPNTVAGPGDANPSQTVSNGAPAAPAAKPLVIHVPPTPEAASRAGSQSMSPPSQRPPADATAGSSKPAAKEIPTSPSSPPLVIHVP